MLYSDSKNEIWSRFVLELVIWTQLSGPLCLWQCFSFAIESSLSPTTEEGFLSLHWYSNHDMGCGHPINSFFPSAASVFQTLLLIIWFSSTEESFIGYSQVSKFREILESWNSKTFSYRKVRPCCPNEFLPSGLSDTIYWPTLQVAKKNLFCLFIPTNPCKCTARLTYLKKYFQWNQMQSGQAAAGLHFPSNVAQSCGLCWRCAEYLASH